TREAKKTCREMTAAETTVDHGDGSEWDAWVQRFLEQRYSHTPRTLARYLGVWKNVRNFLDAFDIAIPRQLTRQNVRDFVDWRQERHAEHGCYEVAKNTALHELKLLRIVMNEAVQCGFATVNPCLSLGIKRDPAPLKPRITDAEHKKILKALEREPEWMQISYAICWEQG